MKPLISVIVPVYNVEKYIRKCIDSIIQQTYENLQIILVDDGSSDSSGKICDEYAISDKRIMALHKKNGGTASARNLGIESSEGDYIAFIDSDDYIEKDMIEVLYRSLDHANADISICGYSYIDESGRYLEESGNVSFPDEVITDTKVAFGHFLDGHAEYYVVVWNKLYRKEIWKNLRFPEDRICEDAYVAHHIISRCKTIIYVNSILYFYVQRDSSKMSRSSDELLFRYTKDALYAYIDRIVYFENHSYHEFAIQEYERTIMFLVQNIGGCKTKYERGKYKQILDDFEKCILLYLPEKYYSCRRIRGG